MRKLLEMYKQIVRLATLMGIGELFYIHAYVGKLSLYTLPMYACQKSIYYIDFCYSRTGGGRRGGLGGSGFIYCNGFFLLHNINFQ